MAVTIHDVARRAKVSVATVSRALAEPHLLRQSTLERVLKIAKKLDYHPNRAARSLITGKTGNIGIIVPDVANPFYPSVLRGVQAGAHQAGYSVLLGDSEENPAAEEKLVHTMAKQVDGVILCAPFGSDARLLRLAKITSIVLVNRRLRGVPAVLMNVASGMRQLVGHLAALGHRRCAYLGGPSSAWSNVERLRGLRAAAKSQAIQLVEIGSFEPKFEGGIEGADRAIAAGVTAIVAYNDLMALGVLSRLHARNIRVPEDISVVGFDDVLYAAMCAPPLTTVSMPMEAAGRTAVDILLRGLDDAVSTADRQDNTQLPTEMIVRSTTAESSGTERPPRALLQEPAHAGGL